MLCLHVRVCVRARVCVQATLTDLRDECAASTTAGATYVFDSEWPLIVWHRVADFQLVTIKSVARAAVHAMPPYASLPAPDVYITDEIGRQKLRFREAVVLYVSAYNPGAATLAHELHAAYGRYGFKLSHQLPKSFAPWSIEGGGGGVDAPASPAKQVSPLMRTLSRTQTFTNEAIGKSMRTIGLSQGVGKATHMLLYLRHDTFVGETGRELAHEVRQAFAHALPIVLVHEMCPNRHGCAFDRFFRTTPGDLLDEGLYRKIAVACHPAPYRKTSLALVARACGARSVGGLNDTLQETTKRASMVVGGVGQMRNVAVLAPSIRTSSAERGSTRTRSRRSHGKSTSVGAAVEQGGFTEHEHVATVEI